MMNDPVKTPSDPPPSQDQIMQKGGYLSAAVVARLTGHTLTALYKKLSRGQLPGATKVDGQWYVDRNALLEHYNNAPPIRKRIEEYES